MLVGRQSGVGAGAWLSAWPCAVALLCGPTVWPCSMTLCHVALHGALCTWLWSRPGLWVSSLQTCPRCVHSSSASSAVPGTCFRISGGLICPMWG